MKREKKLRRCSPDLSVFTNKHTTSHRKAEEMAGQVLIRETKGKGGEEDWGGGVSVQCVETGRPELVGGKASKARAQPPHSHQLRGMWRQRTRASAAAPQPHSFSFAHYSTDRGPVSQKHPLTAATSAQLCANSTWTHQSSAWEVCGFHEIMALRSYDRGQLWLFSENLNARSRIKYEQLIVKLKSFLVNWGWSISTVL